MPRRVTTTPVLPKVDNDNFWAWNKRRTVKHRIDGVQKIQDYYVDTHRWSVVFSKHLGSAPSLTPGPIEKKKRPSKRWAPYSSAESPALSGARTRSMAKREELAAVAATNGVAPNDQAARDEAIRAEVLDKTRARFDARQSKCSDCGERFTDNTGKCGEKCRIAFEAYSATFEARSLEIRKTDMGYGVFVRPGCGGVKENVALALYLGAVIPFSAPELKAEGSRYLFELHDIVRGSKKNQICIDSAAHGNWTRFVNANCKPNCESMLVTVGKRAYLLYVTVVAVEEGKELTVSYGSEYFRDGETECLCDAFEGPHIPPNIPPAK